MNHYVLSSRSLFASGGPPSRLPSFSSGPAAAADASGDYPILSVYDEATRADAQLVAARLIKTQRQGGTDAVVDDIAGCYAAFERDPAHNYSVHAGSIRFCVLYDFAGYKVHEARVKNHREGQNPYFEKHLTYSRVHGQSSTLHVATEQEYVGYVVHAGELIRRLIPEALYFS